MDEERVEIIADSKCPAAGSEVVRDGRVWIVTALKWAPHPLETEVHLRPKYAEADVLKALLWAIGRNSRLAFKCHEWTLRHTVNQDGPSNEWEWIWILVTEASEFSLGVGPIPDTSLLPVDALDRLMAAWEGAK